MPLANDDLIALLRKEEEAASGYQDAALSAVREEALAYYDRQPYGDEQEGASSIVTSEFADVVESLMPGLMRVFTGSDDLAKFAPMAPGQEKWAKEASEYVPHVLMRQNDGFRIISALLKDALMYRLSGATVDLEDVEDKRSVPVQNLTQDAIDLIVSEAAGARRRARMELVGDPPTPPAEASEGMRCPTCPPSLPEEAPGTFSGTITVTHKRKRVVVDSIAPEDIRFSPAARDEDEASFLGFIKRVTSSDLVKLGLTQEEIDDLSADKGLSDEAAQRNEGVLDAPNGQAPSAMGRATASDRCGWSWPTSAPTPTATASRRCCAWSMPMRAARQAASSSARSGRAGADRAGLAHPDAARPRRPLAVRPDAGPAADRLGSDPRHAGQPLHVNRPRPAVSDPVILDSLLDWVPGSPIRFKPGARPGDGHVAWQKVPNDHRRRCGAGDLATVGEPHRHSRHNQGLDAET